MSTSRGSSIDCLDLAGCYMLIRTHRPNSQSKQRGQCLVLRTQGPPEHRLQQHLQAILLAHMANSQDHEAGESR